MGCGGECGAGWVSRQARGEGGEEEARPREWGCGIELGAAALTPPRRGTGFETARVEMDRRRRRMDASVLLGELVAPAGGGDGDGGGEGRRGVTPAAQ